jgi:hypothetical protein
LLQLTCAKANNKIPRSLAYIYIYIYIVRSIFFARAVVGVADVTGATVSGFSSCFPLIIMLCPKQCYVIIIYIISIIFVLLVSICVFVCILCEGTYLYILI